MEVHSTRPIFLYVIDKQYRDWEENEESDLTHLNNDYEFNEKKEEIWLDPMAKAHTHTENQKKKTWKHKNATKTSIAQRLRTDLGWSVGKTKVTQVVPTLPL